MNQITLNFEECDTPPSMGYSVWFKAVGTIDAFRLAGVFFTSPAVFTDTLYPPGTDYSGIIYSNCNVAGNPVSWSTVQESGSSGSDVTPCKQITLSKTVGTPSAHYRDCNGTIRDTLIEIGTVICTNGHGYTISGGGVTVDSEVEGDCDPDFDYYFADEYQCSDCTVSQSGILVRVPKGHVVQVGKFYRPVGHPTGFVYALEDIPQPPASSVQLTGINLTTCANACL